MTNDPSSSPFGGLSFLLPTTSSKTEEQKVEDELPTSHTFEEWLRAAPAADTICYAKGIAWLDGRNPKNQKEHLLSKERREVCKQAYLAYTEGKVELYQRKSGRGNYSYHCQKRREVKPIFIPMGCGRTDLI
jgi:hypothetical protein